MAASEHPMLDCFEVASARNYMLGKSRQVIKGENANILSEESWTGLFDLLNEVKNHFKKLDVLTEKITTDLSFLNHVSKVKFKKFYNLKSFFSPAQKIVESGRFQRC